MSVTAFELGLALELEAVNLIRDEQFSPEFVELNPNHMIPFLVDGDFVLWESAAIMQYLCGTAAAHALWPDEPRTQAASTAR